MGMEMTMANGAYRLAKLRLFSTGSNQKIHHEQVLASIAELGDRYYIG